MIWIRDELQIAVPVDTVIFDVDGVLIDDTLSYYAAVKASVNHVVAVQHGRAPAHAAVTDADILAFKTAGGFNDDWVLSYTLCGIILGHRDGQRPPFAEIAAESGGRGMPWVRERYFPSLDLDLDAVIEICKEHYWGEELLRKHWGRPARHYRGPGFVRQERPLIGSDFLERLGALGVCKFGIITGRSRVELETGLEMLGLVGSPRFGFVLDAETIRKPDPRALTQAVEALRPSQALYIGDTGDDLQLVLNYRQSKGASTPCLAAVVARPKQRSRFMQGGADIVLDETEELVAALRSMPHQAG